MIATIYWSDPAAALYVGDARAVLERMPDCSADCIVTSPPYWAKRDYGVTGQYGHEPSPVAYVDTLRTVFAEARRVFAGDGTCWLNLGDSYSVGGSSPTGMHTYLGPNLSGRAAPGLLACGQGGQVALAGVHPGGGLGEFALLIRLGLGLAGGLLGVQPRGLVKVDLSAASAPCLAANQDGRLEIFVKTVNDMVQHVAQDATGNWPFGG